MLRSSSVTFAATIAVVLLIAGCGGSEDQPANGGSEDGVGPVTASFDEGTIRMEIEFLDTGLLKGHAYADATDGWTVERISVLAMDHEGSAWTMIEPPGEQVGFGTASASEFFEVRLEELPRGEQLTITQTVTFTDGEGAVVERSVEDRWPP
jgi:hypothetical protein